MSQNVIGWGENKVFNWMTANLSYIGRIFPSDFFRKKIFLALEKYCFVIRFSRSMIQYIFEAFAGYEYF